MKRRSSDPEHLSFIDKRTRSGFCIDHENRINDVEEAVERIDSRQQTIDARQQTIYKSMYGPNGNPKEGYVWQLEQVLDWAMVVKQEWGWLRRIAMGGALSAIGVGIWIFIQMVVTHGFLT